VSFAAITLYVASQLVFIVVSLYFVIDSVRKLLDTPSCRQNAEKRFAGLIITPFNDFQTRKFCVFLTDFK
jgi:hypothetical protein